MNQVIQPEVATMTAITRAEIDVAISTAKQYPRNPHEFIENAIQWATYDEETAEDCIYSVKKGGQKITGPSVRLAEICVQAYGNLRVASRLVEEQDRFIVCEAVAHDLESNTAHRAEVVASIWGNTGRYSNDMIQTTALAAQAKARRNAIFAVIPGAWVKKVLQAVQDVNAKTEVAFDERRKKAWDFLVNECGIEPRLVLAKVGARTLEDVTRDDLEVLKSAALDLREGFAIEDLFPEPETDEKPKKKGEAGKVQSLLDDEGDVEKPEPEPKKKAKKSSKKKSSKKAAAKKSAAKKRTRKRRAEEPKEEAEKPAEDPQAFIKDFGWDDLEEFVEGLESKLDDAVVDGVLKDHPDAQGNEVRIEDLQPYAIALHKIANA